MKNSKSTLYNDLKRQILATQSRDARVMVEQKNRFHAVMGERAGNQYLELSLKRLLIDLARIGHSLFRPLDQDAERYFQRSADQHDSFIAAIERRDKCAVVELVFKCSECSRQTMEKFAPLAARADLPIQSLIILILAYSR